MLYYTEHFSRTTFFSVLMIAILCVLFAPHSLAQSEQEKLKPNPRAERWILNQVANGKDGNLADLYPQTKERVISASFLERLLTNSSKDVKVHLRGIHIMNATFIEPLNFQNAKIPYPITLSKCQFYEAVDFMNVEVEGDLNFDESTFKSSAVFQDVEVKGDAFFRSVIFEGKVDFLGATTSRSLEILNSHFKNPEEEARFEELKCEGNALFGGTIFEGPANFRGLNISGNFYAANSQFKNPNQEASFEGMEIGRNVDFGGTIFEGPAFFRRSNIGGSFFADNAQFKNPDKGAFFEVMEIKRDALFREVNFQSSVDFLSTKVDGAFAVIRSNFANQSESANFESMKVDRALFEGAQFAGPYHLSGMTYQLINAGSWDDTLNLVERASYNADVYSGLEAFAARQGNVEHAKDVYIMQKRRERRENLNWSSWIWNILLDMLVGYGRRAWLAFVYSTVIVIFGLAVFRRKDMELKKSNNSGLEEKSESKKSESGESKSEQPESEKPKSEKNKSDNPESEPTRYNAFWYSLDLFLPFIDLQVDSVWRPKQNRKFARNYVYIHTILGWLLIPIGLAALTGIIK